MIRFLKVTVPVAVAIAMLASSACGFKRKKYENPITKDTQQPDKILFDKSIRDIEKGRYELARLTLNTLVNTYDSSEFLAKAKLAIADSWYREGGTHGLAQAEAEYKDFILFYPAMEEAAESQKRICDIHIAQMEKADRDPNNALRAEYECKQLITQWPNSKFVPEVEQKLRNVQEALAEAEVRVGDYYHHKGSNAAAANRLGGAVDQYPLYSRADFALWEEADSYRKMGKAAREKEGEALTKIVRDYPLSPYVANAKKRLTELEIPIPEADPRAVAHMKFEQENHKKESLIAKDTQFLKRGPDTHYAALSGMPTMTNPKASIPLNVPVPATAATAEAKPTTGVNDVTIAPVASGSSALDTKPDARGTLGAAEAAKTDGTASAAKTDTTQTTQTTDTSKSKKKKDKKKTTAKTTATQNSPSQ